MKKIAMFLLTCMLMLCIAGCSNDTIITGSQPKPSTPLPTTQQTEPTTLPVVTTTAPIEATEPTQPTELPTTPPVTTAPTVPTAPQTKPTEPVHVHTWENATCTMPKTCSECGQTEGKALGHSWQDATCTTPKTCTVCHTTEGNMLDHTWDRGVVTKEATEETEGELLYTCTSCGQTKTQSIPVIGHVHAYTEVIITSPSCTQKGFTTHTCPCGDSYTDSETPALGHDWKEATCVSAKTCQTCGATDGVASGHKWTEATCTAPKTCSVCETKNGTALGHHYSKVVTAPTCTEQGHSTYTCIRCEDNYVSDYVNALGHDYADATCTMPKTCTACGLTTGTTLDHTWDQGIVIREATEETDGEKLFTCVACAKTMTQIIPALGHVHHYSAETTAPTCTQAGFTTHTCGCGESYTDRETPATGHHWQNATCTTPKTCKTCGTTEGTAKGHDWKNATCTAPKTCKICDATDGSSLGHNYISGVCDRCGDKTATSSSFRIHFIDVGQADAALIECDGHYMLIDGGNKTDADTICNILKQAGVQKLDIVVASHAHADHIGGLVGVFDFTTADMTLCPITSYDTKTFADFADRANRKGGGITVPSVGDTYTLGSATITILSVNASKDADNSSMILRIDYGATSFIFTGDAERAAEQAALHSGLDLSATVLKVGKHGSDTGTTDAFLDAIKPAYAVISVGADNTYGHPTEATLHRLQQANVMLFRTDLQGDIFCTSDGERVTFSVTKNPDADVFDGPNPEEPGTEPLPDPDPEPKPDPEPEGLQILSWPETIGRNETGTVTIRGKANTEYTITVYYKSGPASADGLEAKISDADGYVTWSWKVGGRTSPGTYKIVIQGGGETIEVEFTVTK